MISHLLLFGTTVCIVQKKVHQCDMTQTWEITRNLELSRTFQYVTKSLNTKQ